MVGIFQHYIVQLQDREDIQRRNLAFRSFTSQRFCDSFANNSHELMVLIVSNK